MKLCFDDVLIEGVWARRTAILFILGSTLWIIISDFVVASVARTPSEGWMMQSQKGLIYVLICALALWAAFRRFEVRQHQIRAANEHRLRLLKESGLIGVASFSATGRFTDANWVLREMLGRPLHALVGTKAEDLLGPGFEDERRQAEKEFTTHGRTGLFRCDLVRAEGGTLPVVAGKARIADSGESIAYFLDVSPVISGEEQKLKLQEQLLHAEKMAALGQFASGIAHNFNNELSIIVGYGSVLQDHLVADKTSSSHIQQVLDSAERCRKLIQQLVAFSRKKPIHPEIVDVNAVLKDLEPSLRRVMDPRVDLRVEVSSEAQWIKADSSQLAQIVLNLASNAQDAMPNGGALLIAVESGDRNGSPAVTIEVADDGMGMDDRTAQHIFEPFFTTKLDSGGTGLGLATVYGIVQQNCGEIEVISRVGAGTTFKVSFPKREIESPSPTQLPPPETQQMRGKILLVEDRDDIRELMSQVLVSSGLTVVPARDGLEAVEAASEEEVNLMLTDIVMPRMNGPEAVQIIRASHPRIKVIYLSGSADLIEPNGRDVVMWKPIQPQTLLAAVRSCLAQEESSAASIAA